MKKIIAWTAMALTLLMVAHVGAQDQATPQDVYDMVLKGHQVLKNLGDEGLQAFNDPKGEFVFKDSYVFVVKCPDSIAAHPFALEKLKGRDLRKDFPFQKDFCEAAQDPNGRWVEYEWPKPGEKEPSRKIAFVIGLQGTPYALISGIYNNDITLEELQKTMK